MKKSFLLIILMFISIFFINADSESLNTEITTVSFGPHGLGFGLAPTGTNFMYYDYYTLSKQLQHPAYFKLRLIFGVDNNAEFGYTNYKTGSPLWSYKNNEIKDWSPFIKGNYLNTFASATIYTSQGFGSNPVSSEDPLVTVGLEFNSFYEIATENLDVSRGTAPPVFVDPISGNPKEPFMPGEKIQAFPWLQDTRRSLINTIAADIKLNLDKRTGFGACDGLDAYFRMEYAPQWLANTISMALPTADYYKLDFTLNQNLTLYARQQDNGLNWLTIMIEHSNTLSRIHGSVIPKLRLPWDSFENSFSDRISIVFNGPQFIAWDCYTYFTLNLTNTCLFGHLVNEFPQTTEAVEWQSNMNMYFHMRLFGFMHFDYTFGYNLMTGIHNTHPGFYQEAKISFFIAL